MSDTQLMTSPLFIKWAQQRYYDQITDLLDDPAWIQMDRNFCKNFISIGAILGIDFWSELKTRGSEYEQERFRSILASLDLKDPNK